MNLLALLLSPRRPVPPRVEPVDPPPEVLPPVAGAVPLWAVPDRLRWEQPEPADLAEEGSLLDRVAVLVDGGASPWDAASRVFGGADETPGTAGAGLYASLAGEAAVSVPR